VVTVALGPDDSGGREAPQAVGQHVGRNRFGRILKLCKAAFPAHQVADDEQRPPIAEQVERARHGTPRSPRRECRAHE